MENRASIVSGAHELGRDSRILVRGTNWLGDAVMTTPALWRLREKFPNHYIALLTPEKLKDLWLNHPSVSEVISFSQTESIFAVAKKLRMKNFDEALVLPNSPRSAIEVFLARIPRRLGYSRPWRNFFLTQAIAPRGEAVKMHKRSVSEIKKLIAQHSPAKDGSGRFPQCAHQSLEYLHLAKVMGASAEAIPPKLFVTSGETETAARKFRLEQLPRPIVGLNAGAEYGPAKRWPVERFIAAVKEVRSRMNCGWILFGGKYDVPLAGQIESAVGGAVLNMAGKTSLRELMSLLKCCRVFLTNDTGPMHVAAALGVPMVAIFGSTSPELTGPMPASDSLLKIVGSNAPCSPCFLRKCPIDFRCMKGIGAGPVVDAVMEMLMP